MKKIKYFFGITAWLVAIMLLAVACTDSMDIYKVYTFDLAVMPVQKRIVQGELRLDNGTVLLPNDLYPLSKETFRMYYTSHCTDQQVIDVYIEDNHGQVVQKTFSWQNDKGEDESEDE